MKLDDPMRAQMLWKLRTGFVSPDGRFHMSSFGLHEAAAEEHVKALAPGVESPAPYHSWKDKLVEEHNWISCGADPLSQLAACVCAPTNKRRITEAQKQTLLRWAKAQDYPLHQYFKDVGEEAEAQ